MSSVSLIRSRGEVWFLRQSLFIVCTRGQDSTQQIHEEQRLHFCPSIHSLFLVFPLGAVDLWSLVVSGGPLAIFCRTTFFSVKRRKGPTSHFTPLFSLDSCYPLFSFHRSLHHPSLHSPLSTSKLSAIHSIPTHTFTLSHLRLLTFLQWVWVSSFPSWLSFKCSPSCVSFHLLAPVTHK